MPLAEGCQKANMFSRQLHAEVMGEFMRIEYLRGSKRFCMSLAVVIMSALLVSPVYAAPNSPRSLQNGAPVEDPTLTQAEIRRWAELTAAKEQALQGGEVSSQGTVGAMGIISEGLAVGSFGFVTRDVPNFRQETGWWCGPASARQSLAWHRRVSNPRLPLPSQATLAGRIGTTQSGSLTTGIARALNRYNGVFGRVNYAASDLTNQSNPLWAFRWRVGISLHHSASPGTVPVILVQTRYIPRYEGRSSRHYISISGYDERATVVKMRSVDPHWDSRFFGAHWDPVGTSTTRGLFRACLEADRAGTNMAMVW